VYTSAQDAAPLEQGQLGAAAPSAPLQFVPVPLPTATVAADVACGTNHTLVLDRDGHVYGFGCNRWGQISQGEYKDETAVIAEPTPVGAVLVVQESVSCSGDSRRSSICVLCVRQVRGLPKDLRCTKVAAGGNTSAFVLESPTACEVYTVGHGQYGQLGNNTVGSRFKAGVVVRDEILTGGDHPCLDAPCAVHTHERRSGQGART